MKHLVIVITTFFLSVGALNSQSVEDARKLMYYERFESAKNTLQSLIKKGDTSPEAWYWLGEIYMHQNEIDSAKKFLEEGTAYFSQHDYSLKKNPLLFIGKAHLLLEQGNTAGARKLFGEVLEEGKYKNAEALLAAAKANL